MPQDKVGMCKEAPGRSPSYSKRAGAKEPTSRKQRPDKTSTPLDAPKIKEGMRGRSSKKKPSIQQGQELEDPSNGTKIKKGSTLTKEYLLARIKSQVSKKDVQPGLVS